MTVEEMMKKAQELVGSWICGNTDRNEYLYVYDYYDWDYEDDVKLCCIAINSDDAISQTYIKKTEIWMSEFDEYYRKTSNPNYDKMFKGE